MCWSGTAAAQSWFIIAVAEKPQFGNRRFVTVTKGNPISSLSQDAVRYPGAFCRTMEFLPKRLQSCWGHNKGNKGLVWASLTERTVTDNIYENDFSGLASFWSGVPSTCADTSLLRWGTRHEMRSNPAPTRRDAACQVQSLLLKGNAVVQSPCTKPATQGLLKDLLLLLLLLYLMPTSRYWQSIWSLQNWIYRHKFLLTVISVSDPETQRSVLTTAMRGLAVRLITMQNVHTVRPQK